MVALGTMAALYQAAAAQQTTAVDPNGMEVLTRGPVHEAFAETITFDPEPGIVVAKAPPEPIEEIAPDQRPEGANVTWIPGYWGWDDERNDYLWLSGIWRSLPPGRQWVPGYWGQSQRGSQQQGFQWTSGYWADAGASEIDYLPEPPASVEAGPNVAAPSADDTWLPGSWVWQQNRYGWRPGYWTKGNQDWDWVPDHYVWTPRGYVFVDGYYDYSVPRRGVVFAPVYFNQGLRSQRGFSYSPSTVINSSVFGSHLFLRPNYGHYYFGDYYGSNYENAGYSPWFSFQSSRRGYDPIYANQRWQNRSDRGWEQRAQANYRNYRDNEDSRPPRDWAAQRELAGRRDPSNRRDFAVATPLDEVTRRNDGQLRFQPVDQTERQQYGQRGQEYRRYLQQRQQLEANAAGTPGQNPANAIGPGRSKFSRSPYVAQSADQLGRDYAPPQRHQVMKPDFQVQPQPRTRAGGQGTRSGFDQGQVGGQPGQNQIGPQGQQQRRSMNQGNRQGGGQQIQRQGGGQGNRQRATGGQPQGQGQGGQPQGEGGGGSNNQSGASGGSQQQAPQNQPADEPQQ